MKKQVVAIYIAIIFVFQLSACQVSPKPEKTIDNFVNAYNNGDFNAMLDCFDPTISRGIRALVDIVGGIVGISLNDIMDLIPLLYRFTDELSIDSNAKPQMRVDVLGTDIDGDNADVRVNMVVSADGQSYEMECVFRMVKTDDVWYIESLGEQ